MENSFIRGLVDAFRNWKAMILNVVLSCATLIITYFFVSVAIENLIIISATQGLTIFGAAAYYLVINPWSAIVFFISLLALLFLGALSPTITLNLFEKKPLFTNYWKVFGLILFTSILGAITTSMMYLFSFNLWVFLIFFILFLIFWLFLSIRLFYMIPTLVFEEITFKDAWENAKKKVKKRYANIIILIILFLLILNVVDSFAIALYSYFLPLYGYYIIASILFGIVITWVLMTMYHKY